MGLSGDRQPRDVRSQPRFKVRMDSNIKTPQNSVLLVEILMGFDLTFNHLGDG